MEGSHSPGILLLQSICELGHLKHPFSQLHLLEFYLEKFAHLPNGRQKMITMLRRSAPNENDAIVQERSFLAEATAARVLVEKLQLRVSGFDRRSSRATGGADCDIEAMSNGTSLFFEVKAKSSQQKHQSEVISKYLGRCNLFTPDGDEDIAAWLFQRESFGKDRERKRPQIEEAERKGADYLMALVPQWKAWDSSTPPMQRFIHERMVCEQIGEHSFASKDAQLGSEVTGLILFAPLGDYFVIENLNVSRHVARISV